MSRVFVDSSVWIAYLRGTETGPVQALARLLDALDADSADPDPRQIVVGDLVLLEVLRGVPDDREHATTRAKLLHFDQVEVGGTEIALAAADHYRALRARGITVRKAIDCLIAAWCIAHDVCLLHDDRDFAPFAEHRGLRLHTA